MRSYCSDLVDSYGPTCGRWSVLTVLTVRIYLIPEAEIESCYSRLQISFSLDVSREAEPELKLSSLVTGHCGSAHLQ